MAQFLQLLIFSFFFFQNARRFMQQHMGVTPTAFLESKYHFGQGA